MTSTFYPVLLDCFINSLSAIADPISVQGFLSAWTPLPSFTLLTEPLYAINTCHLTRIAAFACATQLVGRGVAGICVSDLLSPYNVCSFSCKDSIVRMHSTASHCPALLGSVHWRNHVIGIQTLQSLQSHVSWCIFEAVMGTLLGHSKFYTTVDVTADTSASKLAIQSRLIPGNCSMWLADVLHAGSDCCTCHFCAAPMLACTNRLHPDLQSGCLCISIKAQPLPFSCQLHT